VETVEPTSGSEYTRDDQLFIERLIVGNDQMEIYGNGILVVVPNGLFQRDREEF